MIVGAEAKVDVPAVAAARGGILSVATVIAVTDPHQMLGAEYESMACADAQTIVEFCTQAQDQAEAPAEPSDFAKVFEGNGTWITGSPFAVYAGTDCALTDLETARQRAAKALEYAERRQIDQFVTALLAASTPTSVTTAEVPVAVGMALLEEWAAGVYGGVPVITAPITAVGCAGDYVDRGLDGTLTTSQGALVANVATAALSDPDAMDIYASGRIVLLQGPVQTYSVPPMVRSDGSMEPQRALAERVYVPLIECLVAKADVSCS